MATDFKRWRCQNCGFIYDEELGSAEDNLAPGTRWDDIPDDWYCPTCGTEKVDFEMIEID